MKQNRPHFQEGAILRASTLQTLCDYTYLQGELQRKGFSDGIISGLELHSTTGELHLGTGVFALHGSIFYLEQPMILSCIPNERQMIVKLRETMVQEVKNYREHHFSLVQEEAEAGENEVELCRFTLQVGASLRYQYADFRDVSTEYDTINLQYAQYSGYGRTTVHKHLLTMFAEELLLCRNLSSLDENFALLCLSQGHPLNFAGISAYINMKIKETVQNQGEAYDKLLQILQQAQGEQGDAPQEKKETRPRILID